MSEATKTGRKPNTQPNGLVPALSVEVFLGDEALGAIQVPQDEFLSKNGNVLFHGRIARGWQLPGDPSETLGALRFVVNGQEATRSETGVHLTAPRTNKDGKTIPNTGGELIVAHTSIQDLTVDQTGQDFMVNVFAKKVRAKAGKEQHYSLRVQGMPKAIGTPGVQVVGEVSGLLVTS